MKRRQSQADIVKNLTDRALILNLYMTQGLLLLVAIIAGWFLFDNFPAFAHLFHWAPGHIVLYGSCLAIAAIAVDFACIKWLPKKMYDDGGINERIFAALSICHIFWLTLFIALVEEVLFRGVLQSHFGLVIASLLFALLHVRYLHKFLLFAVTVGLSFLLGVVFFYTQNLWITIFAHFLIDFVSGTALHVKNQREGENNGKS